MGLLSTTSKENTIYQTYEMPITNYTEEIGELNFYRVWDEVKKEVVVEKEETAETDEVKEGEENE